MDRLKLSLLGAVALAAVNVTPGTMGTAQAADLLPPPPVVEAPEVVTKRGGWYLRGDISYDFQESRDLHFPLAKQRYKADIDDAFNIGLGIGYQVTDNFRVDLTGEYVFSSDFEFKTGNKGVPCFRSGVDYNNVVSGNCSSTEHSEVSKFKLLSNAYYDIGHFGGFTPYVGVGIGGAYVKYDDLTTTETCTMTVTVPGQYCPDPHAPHQYVQTTPSSTYTQTTTEKRKDFKGESEWRFAYALHAGGAYSISDHLKLDIGYTYSRIKGGKAFTLNTLNSSPVGIYDKGFNDHTVRAGLRYHLW